jgi:hypothetical protein
MRTKGCQPCFWIAWGLSTQKVESFRRNLLGDLHPSTNDVWMALFGGIPEDFTRTAYKMFTANVLEAARLLGWQPAEAQETIGSFVRALAGLQKGGLSPGQALRHVAAGHVLAAPDFVTLVLHDPQSRALVERLFPGVAALGSLGASRPSYDPAEPVARRAGGVSQSVLTPVAWRASSPESVAAFRGPR